MELDHIAIVAADLDQGARAVSSALGVSMGDRGRHGHYGTHNRLVSLGKGQYLEVIAPDPVALNPRWPRWFGLDDPPAIPQVGNWIVRVPNLTQTIKDAPIGTGDAVALERNGIRWEIAVPPDGSLPMEGGWPTCLQWTAGPHPSEMLDDQGVRLLELEVQHPRAEWLAEHLVGRVEGVNLAIRNAPVPKLECVFETPSGLVRF